MSNDVHDAQVWINEYQARCGVVQATPKLKEDLERSVELCRQLLQERNRLRSELEQLRSDNARYVQALYALTHQQFDIDKADALAQFGKEQPLAALIAELEAQAGNA
jgi:hypothetical protein